MVWGMRDNVVKFTTVWSVDGDAFETNLKIAYSVDGSTICHESDIGSENFASVASQLIGYVNVASSASIHPKIRSLSKQIRLEAPADNFKGEMEKLVFFARVRESSGEIGFVTAALALINHGLVSYRDRPRPPGQRVLNGKLRPYMSDSVVSIAIPGKLSPIGALKRAHRAEQARKRAHEVRGHFRHYRDGRVVWIRSHQRGDASLGFVRQRYEVVAAQ